MIKVMFFCTIIHIHTLYIYIHIHTLYIYWWVVVAKSVVQLFKIPVVEVVVARLSNRSALPRTTDSTKKNLVDLLLVLDGRVDSNFPDEGSFFWAVPPRAGGSRWKREVASFWDVTKQGVNLLFHPFGSFHS